MGVEQLRRTEPGMAHADNGNAKSGFAAHRLNPLGHGALDMAQPIEFARHHIAGLQEPARVHGSTDAAGSAR